MWNLSRGLQRVIGRRFLGLSAEVTKDELVLTTEGERGKERFPLVWLRDNCSCESCYHGASSSRTINWNAFNINVGVDKIQTVDDSVLISWADDHRSEFKLDWLKKRSFSEEAQQEFLTKIYRPNKVLWTKEEFFDVLKIYEFNDVLNDKNIFCKWLEDLIVYGVVLMKNTPLKRDISRIFAEQIAFIKKTHYGEDHEIRNKPNTQNVAYLSSLLQLHTDLPYYNYSPGVTMLHYIEQTKTIGGENLLTDAFHVAEKLRNENKDVFNALADTLINWSDIGEEDGVTFYKLIRKPVISLDADGNIEKIRHSIPQRDTYFTSKIEDVTKWYRALRIFVDQINENAVKFKLDEGDFLAFDNTRLVHGRLSYEDTEDNKRFLVGSYVDWDEVYSKWRILKQELEKLN